jgi:epoxyqueuosine reductase
MTPAAIAEQIRIKGRQIGFDLIGIASTEPSNYSTYFRKWLDEGRNGSMQWLAERLEERIDPAAYFPGARSAICVACNYRVALEPMPATSAGRMARYALGDDYHTIMKDRLHDLADWLRAAFPGTKTRSSVDTAPVMEKELAVRAGIGWMGKNTCVINPDIGSFILLGQILTTLDLPADQPADDRCAVCRRCIDACPTGAITAPYQMDASRCISYLTIENRGEIPAELQPMIGDWLYGCDVCQDVCPWNRRTPETTDPAFAPRFPSGSLPWKRVAEWTEEQYRTELKGSAMKRVKLPMFKRNAAVVERNAVEKPIGSSHRTR